MRPLVIANVERIETTGFLVMQLFGDDGYLLDTVIKRHESAELSIGYVKEIAATYGIDTPEMWTSTRELYLAALNVIGIGASIKHPSDTSCTGRAAEDLRLQLAEIDAPVVKLPRWKAYVIGLLNRVIKTIEGERVSG